MKLLVGAFGQAKSRTSARSSWLVKAGFACAAMVAAFAAQAETSPAYAQQADRAGVTTTDNGYVPSAQVQRATVLAADCMTDFCENTNGRDRRTLADGTNWNGVALTLNGRYACSRMATSYGVTLEELGWERPIEECERRITGRAVADYLSQEHGLNSVQDYVNAGWGRVHGGVFTFELGRGHVVELLRAFAEECQREVTTHITEYAPQPLAAVVAEVNNTAAARDILADDASGQVDQVLPLALTLSPNTNAAQTSTIEVRVQDGFDLSAGTETSPGVWQLTEGQFRDLRVDPPAGFVGSVPLTASVTVNLPPVANEVNLADNTVIDRDDATLTWVAPEAELVEGGLYRVATPGSPNFSPAVPFMTDEPGVATGSFLNARPDGLVFDGEVNLGQQGLGLGTRGQFTYTNGRWEITGGAMVSPQGAITMDGLLGEGEQETNILPFGRVSFDVFNDQDDAFRLRAYGTLDPSLVDLTPANRGSLDGSFASTRLANAAGTDPFAGVGVLAEYSPNGGDTVFAVDVAGGVMLGDLGGDQTTLDTTYICSNNCGAGAEDDSMAWRAVGSLTQNFTLFDSPDASHVTAYYGRFGGANANAIPDHINGTMEGDVMGVSGLISTGRFELEGNYSTLNADCAVNCSRPSELEGTNASVAANVVFRDTPLWGADLRVGPIWQRTQVVEGQYGAPGRYSDWTVDSLGLRGEARWNVNDNTTFSLGATVADETITQQIGRTNRTGFTGTGEREEGGVNATVAARLGFKF